MLRSAPTLRQGARRRQRRVVVNDARAADGMARYRLASPDRAWTRDAMRGDVRDDANARAETMRGDARGFERADVRDDTDLLRE